MLQILLGSLIWVSTLAAQTSFFAVKPESFVPKLSLTEAFEKALSKNERLLQNKEEIPTQRGFAKQSLTAMLPTLQGNGDISKQIGFSTDLKIPLANVAGILGMQSAFKQLQSVKASYERKREALLLDVANAYLSVLTEQQLLNLAKNQHETAKKQFESAMRKASLQEISTLDLKRAQLLSAKTQADIENREASYQASIGLLADFLGENKRFELEDFPEIKALEEGELPKISRSDLKSQTLSIDSAWLSKQSAKWMFMPTFDFNTGWRFPVDKEYEWTFGFSLSVPFFDGYSRYGLFETAGAKYRQEIYKKRLLNREIDLEIQGALVDIKRRKELYVIQQELLAISQSAYKSAENRYNLGSATSLDLLDEQTRLFEAEKDLKEAKFFLLQSRLRLSYVLGDPRQGIVQDG
jgi:outer membrane protein TolC